MARRIEALAEKKKKELDMMYYEKYSGLFRDAYDFLTRKKALMYGGTALNELIPEGSKFYDAYTLPDIDILSPHAKSLAAGMVELYRKNKHQATTFTEALHPGTYKIYSDGIQIADITQCSPLTYKALYKTSVMGKNGVRIVPPQYLRMTLHKILSQPNDAHRWNKGHERVNLFYKTFPVPLSSCVSYSSSLGEDRTHDGVIKALPEETVYFGKKEVEMLLGRKGVDFTGLPSILALTDTDLRQVARRVRVGLGQEEVRVSKVMDKDDFVLPHIIVSVGGKPVAIVFQLSSCIAFNQLKDRPRIAGIHTMLDLFLSMSMSHYPHFKKAKRFLECLADELTRLQQKKPKSRRKLLDQFNLVCHGPSMGVATLKVERVERIIEKKKKKKLMVKKKKK